MEMEPTSNGRRGPVVALIGGDYFLFAGARHSLRISKCIP